MTLGGIMFYIGCRWLKIDALDDAMNAITGRFRRVVQRPS
jgi:diaminopimelate decarboxylase